MKWNGKQQKVLDSIARDHNILVSAAAGSGKTAVLVERIVNSVAEKRCGIDEILVVTFTKAAAAQMKGKIIAEMEKRAYASQDSWLLRQLSIAPNADISTIDSFCNRVVRENFQTVGVDPAYGVFDSGEEALLFEEILDEVLNCLYEDPEFARFARAFTRKTYKDNYLRDLILAAFRVSEAFADPDRWLDSCGSDDWEAKYLMEVQKKAAAAEADLAREAAYYDAETDQDRLKYAPKIVESLKEDIGHYRKIMNAKTLADLADGIPKPVKQFRGKDYAKVYDPEEIEALAARKKDYRDDLKDMVKDISLEELTAEKADHEVVIRHLVRAVRAFRDALMEEKRRRKKYSFSDIAHFAYSILVDRETKEVTAVGKSYAERYRYIYIDEYQDGSDIQEHILNSVARYSMEASHAPEESQETRGEGALEPLNIFMVGDVKQSIYRFRQARPQLFLEKERDYNAKKREGEVLYLNQNFRSRKEILDAANFVFRHLMRQDFGGIDYNEDVQLNVPDHYLEPVDPAMLPEILLTEGKVLDAEGVPVDKDILEAKMIGKRILSLVEEKTMIRVKNETYDKSKPESEENSPTSLRPVRFGDIVILQSVVKKMGPMLRVYEQMGIPVQLEDPKAYFDAEEVIIVLSILQLIDNARQDIPYAAVLNSPIVGCNDAELAYLAMHRKDRAESLYDAALDWLAERNDIDEQEGDEKEDPDSGKLFRELAEGLEPKLRAFHQNVELWKKESVYLSISQLLDRILEQTGFRETAARMPRGEHRLNNLTQLFFKAEAFEQAGNHGLFAFLQYIDKCKIHEEEFAGRGSLSEASNSVSICTIHSSKGLEYPVVFVARLGREFNRKSYENMVTVSADYGLAPNRIRKIGGKYWLSTKGIKKRAVNHLMIMEDLHEQLRLLYVALTRAEQRLFLTAAGNGMNEFFEELCTGAEGGRSGTVPYMSLAKAKSYLDYLMAILQADPKGTAEYFRVELVPTEKLTDTGDAEAAPEEDAEDKQKEETGKEASEEALTGEGVNKDAAEAAALAEKAHLLAERLRADYSFRYEYEAAAATRTKLSVSEIKHAAMMEDSEPPETLFWATSADRREEGEGSGDESAGMTEKEKKTKRVDTVSGADYGTAVHKLMELLPFHEIDSAKKMQDTLKELIRGPFFTDPLRKVLRIDKIGKFYSDTPESLFQRMRRAALRGELFREQQFLVGLPLFDAGEPVALQGIIDAFFYETDEAGQNYVILVDYKTDRVDTPEKLIGRYRAQLSLYKETLESILQLPVREMWFYGFADGLGEIKMTP